MKVLDPGPPRGSADGGFGAHPDVEQVGEGGPRSEGGSDGPGGASQGQSRGQMEKRPERDVAHDAGEERQRLADADGSGPAELVLPDFAPTRRRVPAVDRNGAGDDAAPEGMDPLAELVVVGQVVDQSFESARGRQILAPNHHHGAEGEALLEEGPRLQDLTPEVRVDGHGFTPEGGGDRIGEPIEAIHQSDGRVGHGAGQLLEKVGWREDIGVTHDEVIVSGLCCEDGELGDLGVGAGETRAEHESGVGLRVIGEELPDDFAGGVLRGGNGEQKLHRARVVLLQPAREAFAEVRISALDGLEEADGGVMARGRDPPMERKAEGSDELPGLDGTGKRSQSGGGPEEQHVDGCEEEVAGWWPGGGRDLPGVGSDRTPSLARDVFAAAGIGLAAAARGEECGRHGDEDEKTLHGGEDSEDRSGVEQD